MANIREGYKESGWKQPRRLSHIAMRAIKPARPISKAIGSDRLRLLRDAQSCSSFGLDGFAAFVHGWDLG